MNLTIIGLGRIGTSIGLALGARNEKIRRTGHDIDPETAQRARKLGAVDAVAFNLPESVRQADIVLLALPLDQIEETLGFIRPELKAGVVVLDTAPAKEQVSDWMRAQLPPHCAYVGLLPTIHARYLHFAERGPEAGRADLFEGCLVGVTPLAGTEEAAVDTAVGLIGWLGANPLFIDPQEADGVMAALHLLPQLAAAGLVSAIARQPGWEENRRLAGGPYARAGSVLAEGDAPTALARAALSNRTAALRLLDALIAELHSLRTGLVSGDQDGLSEQILQSARVQAEWSERRDADDWTVRSGPPDGLPPSWRGRLSGWIGRRGPDPGEQRGGG